MEVSMVKSATRRAYEEIKRQLFTGTLEAGERIPVEEFCEALRVSRTPVREALVALESEGLVRAVPRKGYFAREVTFRAALDAWQLRILIEPIAAALAARRATPVQLAGIQKVAQPIGGGATVAEEVARNREYHLLVAQASGAGRLVRLMAGLLDDIERLLYIELDSQHTEGDWQDEHAEITAALEARDPVAAARAVRETFVHDTGFLALQAKSELTSLLGPDILRGMPLPGEDKDPTTVEPDTAMKAHDDG
jgi:DNA-binding GntR family transcriptional regulator